jgi:hypothetical protein
MPLALRPHSSSQTRRSTDAVVLSCDEASPGPVPLPVSVPAVSEVGGTIATGNRLAIPGGTLLPASSFLAMPGGRAGSRFARPGGTTCDFPGEPGCVEVGPVLEICICNPRSNANRRPRMVYNALNLSLLGPLPAPATETASLKRSPAAGDRSPPCCTDIAIRRKNVRNWHLAAIARAAHNICF